MRFEAMVALDRAEYCERLEEHWKRQRLRLIYPVMAFVLLLMAFLWPLRTVVALIAVGGALGALAVYGCFPTMMAARLLRKTTPGIASFRFDDNGFSVDVEAATAQYRYTVITALKETDTLFLLYNNERKVWMLPKNAITGGTAEEFRTFMAQKTLLKWETVNTEKFRRRRTAVVAATVALAFAVIFAVEGAQYVRRPVTFVSTDGDNTCTVTVPYFLQPMAEGVLYEGKEISANAVFFTTKEMQQWFASKNITEPLTLKSFAESQKLDSLSKKMEWVEDGADECYMQYASGASYVCRFLHWTEDGCWQIVFSCPGDRQDTYYNRFTQWRESAVYDE